MNRISQLLISDKVLINMRKLYPNWELKKRIEIYYRVKIKYCMYVVAAGLIICLAVYKNASKNSIIEEGQIARNDYMSGDKDITLKYNADGILNEGTVSFKVSEKKYTDKEIDKIYESFEAKLIDEIFKNNESEDYVTENLCFEKSLDGYPFTISYKTDKPSVLSSEGVINLQGLIEAGNMSGRMEEAGQNMEDGTDERTDEITDERSDGIGVLITVTVKYEEFCQEIILPVCIYEKELSKIEQFEKDLKNSLESEDERSSSRDYYTLPKKIREKQIEFYDEKDKTYIVVLIMTVLAAVLVFILKDQDLEKEVEKRIKELHNDYPGLINKFTLFYNAGMPVKSIWLKICDDYIQDKEVTNKKKYLYEEMILTKKQMTDGMREIDAYEEFAKRINCPEYRVFINMIIQAVQLGKKDLVDSMKRECEDAFIERKNNAKKLFEEAGTKLLIPMFMMLAIVFVIVLFPAFYSFRLYD